jgi:hypothetical protein
MKFFFLKLFYLKKNSSMTKTSRVSLRNKNYEQKLLYCSSLFSFYFTTKVFLSFPIPVSVNDFQVLGKEVFN